MRDEAGSSLSGNPQVTHPRTVQAQLQAQSRERTLCLQPRPAELCYHFSPGTRHRVRGAHGLGERLQAAGGACQPGRPRTGQVRRLVPQRDERPTWGRRDVRGPVAPARAGFWMSSGPGWSHAGSSPAPGALGGQVKGGWSRWGHRTSDLLGCFQDRALVRDCGSSTSCPSAQMWEHTWLGNSLAGPGHPEEGFRPRRTPAWGSLPRCRGAVGQLDRAGPRCGCQCGAGCISVLT